MPARDLPVRPNLEQYKKQAKELLAAWKAGDTAALARIGAHRRTSQVTLADAQFVIAREHGFDSWPKFSRHIERLLFRPRARVDHESDRR